MLYLGVAFQLPLASVNNAGTKFAWETEKFDCKQLLEEILMQIYFRNNSRRL